MKVGLFINTQFPEGFNLAERVPEMVAQVRASRDAGFASLWFPHHWLTHPMQMLQITSVMGYIPGACAGDDDRAEYPDPAAAQSGACRGGSRHARRVDRRQ